MLFIRLDFPDYVSAKTEDCSRFQLYLRNIRRLLTESFKLYTSESVNFLPCLDDNYDAVDSTWKTAYKCSSKRLEISLSDVDIFKGLLWLSVDEMIFCLRAFYDVTSTTRKVAVAARNGYYFGEHCCLPEKLIQPAINQTNRTNL